MSGRDCFSCGGVVGQRGREEQVRRWSRRLSRPATYPRIYRLVAGLPLCGICLEEWQVIGERICHGCGRDLDRMERNLERLERNLDWPEQEDGTAWMLRPGPRDGGRTGIGSLQPEGDELCADCTRLPQHTPFPVQNRGLLLYSQGGKDLLGRYKYRGDERMAAYFASLLAIAFLRSYAHLRFACVTEVPLHHSRLAERGFNQMELVARELSRLIDVPYRSLLLRVKDTAKLSKQKGRKERERSMSGAFSYTGSQGLWEWRAPWSANRLNILLIDDIYTTGSTLRACADAVRKGLGERVQVYGLTCFR
ncbi:ComF family protein [Brevibacillus composti]|uniref:ComF family protein n=1 Tax=Brevibacillus composti TaxID=2796470 RepID=A0A7T5EK59_9BACL|nr:ComF family protein [Brevibacillus composti]QQE74119.1 ComF family protein [Brevibacillus composti]QUO41203.1 ComF family protein [Brevibacillus composti]